MKFYNIYFIVLFLISLGCSNSQNNDEQENLRIKEAYHENGEQKQFYDDGTLKALLNYDKGFLNGKCLFYYDNGKLKQSGSFENNEPYGLFKYYDSLGNFKREINWISGKKEGQSFDYYPNENIVMYNYYNNDTLVYSRYYQENGESRSRLGYPFTTYDLQNNILSVGDTLILDLKVIPNPPHIKIQIILGNIIDSEKELFDSPTYSISSGQDLKYKRVYDKKGDYQLGLVIVYLDKDSGENIGVSIYKNNDLKIKVI
ncbi:toxin-antitoxin system YwqK family antitoxin [Chondrinema litorale]|uniref:toxin-antitoxin system YwqK family antitoxin n=1 Tax=Chondrinema litorale TaxID=2994555 RepID=UPI002542BC7D|nr:hypothetical protein [Chondrinema litorale]UZR98168.1 hypothetical protein OQ292_29660 [Chondrinema litorale]